MSDTFESLLAVQNAQIETFRRFIVNLKKCSKANQTAGYLKGRLSGIVELWKQFHDTHIKLVTVSDHSKEPVPYFSEDAYAEIEEIYYEYFGKITDLLESRSTASPPSSESRLEIRLPTIDLPKFSGQYSDWRTFKDMFCALVGENKSLTGVQKLHYLKSLVNGEAEQLLRTYSVAEANFEPAWDSLCKRYDNNRLLINAQLANLFNISQLKENASSIRHLHDSINESLATLKSFDVQVENWDLPIIHIQSQRLPPETRQAWEQKISGTTEPPNLNSYLELLEARFRTLEALFSTKNRSIAASSSLQTFVTTKFNTCEYCNKNDHNIRRCDKFLKSSVDQRWTIVKDKKVCYNCLSSDHTATKCPSKYGCSHCGQRHHSALHKPAGFSERPSNQVASFHIAKNRDLVLLSTALVKVEIPHRTYTLRALIDTGSQASFISTAAMQRLKLVPTNIIATITGLSNTPTAKAHKMVNFTIGSYNDETFSTNIEAIVLPTLTDQLPQINFSLPNYTHLANLALADPNFNEPGSIDMILGSDVYPKIVKSGIRSGPALSPAAINTALGWILLGPIAQHERSNIICSYLNKTKLDGQLRKFWEVEEPNFTPSSLHETECEEHYRCHHARHPDGRYEVSLPFKTNPSQLGSSLSQAINQLKNLERRFQRDPELKSEYSRCLQEYLDLGHMEVIPDHELHVKPSYYMPHHAVRKVGSTTTKLRVVFNASSKTDSGESLNEILHAGPSLHQDLTGVIMRCRFFRHAYAADMKQMFRKIRISEGDMNYQRIVWRSHPSLPILHYRLRTVTFGITSAPYLAMRTIQQLVHDDGRHFEAGSKILSKDTYVDNVLSGADTIEEAFRDQQEVIQLLRNGGFQLRQWAANHPDLLSDIPEEDRLASNTLCIGDYHSPIPMLGVVWNAREDTLSLKINIDPERPTRTKREILSCICKLFDPLGWCAPVLIKAKVFMKKLWLLGLDWDQPVPDDALREFEKLKLTLLNLDNIIIPRWIKATSTSTFELHGFCDSSKDAYAATVYARVYYPLDKSYYTSILMAKTRVSPIEKKPNKVPPTKEQEKITLPKLELCGAVLLSKLMTKVVHDLGYIDKQIYCWCDSTIVLAWLAKSPSNWKTFVANRVSTIQTSLPTAIWNHVSSGDNPADLATRGIDPAMLSASQLWWHGPNWLSADPSHWPQHQLFETSDEKRKIINLTTQLEWKHDLLPLTKYSSYSKLLRVTSYCFRFIKNCRRSTNQQFGFLQAQEINDALLYWVRTIQAQHYPVEIEALKSKQQIRSKSELKSLYPILQDDNILRVGGRLHHAELPIDEKHPIILPYGHHFSRLIIAHYHHQTLHGGLTQTMHQVRRKFWIPKLRSTVKALIHRCIPCFRQFRAISTQLMGNLPLNRITPSRAFSTTGLDYAGPLSIRMSKGRNPKTYKGYIAIFVCFVTKAIHLEAVSDLTTEALLAALRRFIARRGLCKNIYSDCGTNFVGANSTLNKMYRNCIRTSSASVAESIANDGITWHFIPPGSPHFGGLWEAGFRSMKHHLRRVVGNHILTYEELATVLTQIEACLNSRPLCPLTHNPEELETLTPGHFLIGDALLAPPQEDLTDSKTSGLKRWNLLQKLQQDFWNKWRFEYLHRLQQRPKWQQIQPNPEVGQLVIIKDERMPPLKWMMARITALHPGADGLVRVVDLKTSCSALRRPIHKICILPLEVI